jgi:hypothetical protein
MEDDCYGDLDGRFCAAAFISTSEDILLTLSLNLIRDKPRVYQECSGKGEASAR